MDTSLSNDNGMRGTSHIFIVDYRGGFQAILDSYSCVNIADNEV